MLMAVMLLFVATTPASTVPVDNDVGYAYVLPSDETYTLQAITVDNQFVTVIDQAEYMFTGQNIDTPVYVSDNAALKKANLPPGLQSEYTYNYFDTGPLFYKRIELKGYNRTVSTSSGGVSY